MIQVMNESDVEIELDTMMNCSFIWNNIVDSQTCWKSYNIFQTPNSSFDQECNIILVVNSCFNSYVVLSNNLLNNTFNFLDFIIFQTEWSLNFSNKSTSRPALVVLSNLPTQFNVIVSQIVLTSEIWGFAFLNPSFSSLKKTSWFLLMVLLIKTLFFWRTWLFKSTTDKNPSFQLLMNERVLWYQ